MSKDLNELKIDLINQANTIWNAAFEEGVAYGKKTSAYDAYKKGLADAKEGRGNCVFCSNNYSGSNNCKECSRYYMDRYFPKDGIPIESTGMDYQKMIDNLKSFTKDFSAYGGWNIDNKSLITSLNMAIAKLEEVVE